MRQAPSSFGSRYRNLTYFPNLENPKPRFNSYNPIALAEIHTEAHDHIS